MEKAIAALAAGLVLAMTGTAVAAPAPAAWWRLDEGAGLVAGDSSGNGNTGGLTGGTRWVAGPRGPHALAFDGSTGRVRVPDAASLEPSAVSVTAWVKRSGSPGGFKYIVAKGATGCIAASFGLYTGPDGGLEFYVSNNAGVSYTRSPDAGTGIWDGAWHHVAGTFDGATVRLYVDGSEVGSGTPRTDPIDYGTLDTRDLFIGTYPGCSGLDFSGTIDEPKIFGRALTAAEVTADMDYDFHGFFQPVDNPPALNTVNAGRAMPVKFSLNGNQGLGIFPAGSPASQQIACSTSVPLDAIEDTVTAGSSSLSYDPASDQYTYVWKTEKAWAGTCRRLVVSLDDGTTHTASFRFSR